MVNKGENLVFEVFQLVVPSLKGFNDSQELLVESLIVSLGENHFSREKNYRVPLANFRLIKI